jgi:predicted transcriptional regulator
MKELGMSWQDIKATPRAEVSALVAAYQIYQSMHSYDGYTNQDISAMAKDKPEVRSQYNKYLTINDNYKIKSGQKKRYKKASFGDVIKGQ